jgi:hypothetical protein
MIQVLGRGLAVVAVWLACLSPVSAQSNRYRWAQVTGTAAFAPRDGAGPLVFRNRMRVFEGADPGGNLKDVWYSSDGAHWTELPSAPWAPRLAASLFVYQNALWIVAGNNMQSDVWRLKTVHSAKGSPHAPCADRSSK